MPASLTAVILSNSHEENALISAVLGEMGYRSLLMLTSENDFHFDIGDKADLIIVNLDSMLDSGKRRGLLGKLRSRSVPLIFCVDEIALDDDELYLDIKESGVHVLLRPFTSGTLRVRITEMEAHRSRNSGDCEYQYRDLFFNHNDAILIHRRDGFIIEANPQASKLLGGEDGDPANTMLKNYEPEEFSGVFREMMESTRVHGVVRLEVLLQNARNQVFSAEAFTGKISGERDEYYTVIRDISQRKMIENKFKHRLNMESAMSLIASQFINTENPRERLVEGLEQIGFLIEADAVRLEFYSEEQRLFDEDVLNWVNRRKMYGDLVLTVADDLKAEIRRELAQNEYIYTESWNGQSIPRLFVIPMRYNDELIGALWIHKPDRPLVYEDRILFVMITELFRSYYLQRVSDEHRRQLIGRLETKVNQLNCLFSINHILRQEHNDMVEPLKVTGEILYKNLSDGKYCCVSLKFQDQEFCSGDCGELKDESRLCFRETSQYFGFTMQVYYSNGAERFESDNELIRAVYNELSTYLEQEYMKVQRGIMEIQLHHTQRIEAMGQLASGIAHEMNTPNQYIQDNLNFLRDNLGQLRPLEARLLKSLEACERDIRPLSYNESRSLLDDLRELDMPFLMDEIPRAINQSLEGVRKQKSLIDAMRTYSHPGAVQRKHRRNINRIIEEALILSKFEWGRVARVDLDLSPEEREVPCFPQDLSQVFINLIVNSAHAIADRFPPDEWRAGQELQGQIEIKSRVSGEMFEVSIGDNGVGISPEHLNRIFEPFYTTKEVGKGTGQGLAIAYEIIENRHKGEILLHSTPGEGSEFRLLIPLEDDES